MLDITFCSQAGGNTECSGLMRGSITRCSLFVVCFLLKQGKGRPAKVLKGLELYLGARCGWVVNVTPTPLYPCAIEPVPPEFERRTACLVTSRYTDCAVRFRGVLITDCVEDM